MRMVNEGVATIKIPDFDKISSKAPVFYNPVMELNRDISVLALQRFQNERRSKINVADLFAGSGIRGIRYALEVEGVDKVTANDISEVAVEFIKKNSQFNKADLKITMEDANILLRRSRGAFDVVDIDPFGTPSPFIESAGYSLKKNSLLCITATDTSSLCGTYKKPCIRKYNAIPLKSEYCHENGIRILVGFVALTFAKYKKNVKVKLSHSTQHYMRIYLQIDKGASKTDKSLREDIGFISHCHKCLFRDFKKGLIPLLPVKCPICESRLDFTGPLWVGELQDKNFVKGMISLAPMKKLNKKKEALRLLNILEGESGMPPTFYDIHRICSKLKISAPPIKGVLESLKGMGFKAARTHYKDTAIKSDAPLDKIEEVLINHS